MHSFPPRTVAEPHGPLRRPVGALLVACGLALVAAGLAFAVPVAAGPVPTQASVPGGPSSTTPTTTEDLLTGATTAPPTSTATTGVKQVTPGDGQKAADRDTRRVWMIAGALVGVAVLLCALTVVYWRRTRPPPPTPPAPADPAPARRPSRPPVAAERPSR